jgi:hypothetical protein
MYLNELIESLLNESPELDRIVNAHVLGDAAALNAVPDEITARVQEQVRKQYGDVVTLYHGCEEELSVVNMVWRENSSFTDQFDLEFAGEDGYIVEAQVPVERIKFYIDGEHEFVLTEGALNCAIYTVREYFGL